MFGGFGAGELLIVLVFALIFIGPKKLPELAKGLGKGLREFQKAKDDLMDHVNDAAGQGPAADSKIVDSSMHNNNEENALRDTEDAESEKSKNV